jgi:hypothetical protein
MIFPFTEFSLVKQSHLSLHGATIQQQNARMQHFFSKKPQIVFIVAVMQQINWPAST